MNYLELLPEGTGFGYGWASVAGGQPGREGDLARMLQYGVHEGREAGEVDNIQKQILAECEGPCNLRLEGK